MAKRDCTLTAERVRELFDYDPETGLLTRRVGHPFRPEFCAGSHAGFIDAHGYARVMVDGGNYAQHRIIWMIATGDLPKGVIDHIDGNRSNNRWSNLRDVSRSVNAQNQGSRKRKRSKDLPMGVHFVARLTKNPYVAAMKLNGKQWWIGTFATADEAHAAYLDAKRLFHEGCTI